MKVLMDVRNLTDADIEDLWRMHAALKNADAMHPANDNDDTITETFGPLTLDDVREAMREAQSKVGTTAPLTILKSFNVRKASDLREEQYSEVVSACKKAIADRPSS